MALGIIEETAVADSPKNQKTEKISGQRIYKTESLPGYVSKVSKTYLSQIVYEVDRYEFSILRKGKFKSDFWFFLFLGTALGQGLNIIGKTLSALIQKQMYSVESWELYSVGAGVLIAFSIRFIKFKWKTAEEKEFDELMDSIDKHFRESPRERLQKINEGTSDEN